MEEGGSGFGGAGLGDHRNPNNSTSRLVDSKEQDRDGDLLRRCRRAIGKADRGDTETADWLWQPKVKGGAAYLPLFSLHQQEAAFSLGVNRSHFIIVLLAKKCLRLFLQSLRLQRDGREIQGLGLNLSTVCDDKPIICLLIFPKE